MGYSSSNIIRVYPRNFYDDVIVDDKLTEILNSNKFSNNEKIDEIEKLSIPSSQLLYDLTNALIGNELKQI